MSAHLLPIAGVDSTQSGGYILSPAHCIQPDTPIGNVLAIYDEGRR